MSKKVMIIADQDDVDDFKQRLDLIYTELSELNEMIRETKKEIDTSYEGEE
jgi:hypothetical protein|tara:strand:- start:6275 stop:6427 length:153 start_codon:yes stop_codon:yes gene_type:complete